MKLKTLESAIVAAGLVAAGDTDTAKAAKAKAKAAQAKKVSAARARRSALVLLVMPSGALTAAIAKAKRGKRSQVAAKAAFDAAQDEISLCNVTLRGAY